jgi:hypothetical protein
MSMRLASLALLLLVTGCGGSDDTPGSEGTEAVTNKAVADVDAAMADALRARTAPPAAAAPATQKADN